MKKYLCLAYVIPISVLLIAPSLQANAQVSNADETFASSVFQGGLYEVEASALAEQRGWAPNVKDMAYTEVHDHEQVNHRLKIIAGKAGIPITTTLNASFFQRLAKLKNTPALQFDTAYLIEMEDIHKIDEKLFAKDAKEGSSGFQEFAHETDLIVKRHMGALHALD
jgi:putative membrane protein